MTSQSPTPTGSLDNLLNQSRIWRGSINASVGTTHSSGFADLDHLLPGAGWPDGGVIEVSLSSFGIGEMRLLGPLMRTLSQKKAQWILWVAPPFLPYAPALAHWGIRTQQMLVIQTQDKKEQLWAMEQGLKSQACSLVLGWPREISPAQLRRLQLHATQHQRLCFVFGSPGLLEKASPVSIKMHLESGQKASADRTDILAIQMLKRRGGWAMNQPESIRLHSYHLLFSEGLHVENGHALPAPSPLRENQLSEAGQANIIAGPWISHVG